MRKPVHSSASNRPSPAAKVALVAATQVVLGAATVHGQSILIGLQGYMSAGSGSLTGPFPDLHANHYEEFQGSGTQSYSIGPDGSQFSSAFGEASAGTLKTSLSGAAYTPSLQQVEQGARSYSRSDASAVVNYRDTLRVLAPGHENQLITLELVFLVHGTVSSHGSAPTRYDGHFRFDNGVSGTHIWSFGSSEPGVERTVPSDGRIVLETGFVEGNDSAILLSLYGQGDVQANNYGQQGSFDVNLANTMYWGGIASVSADGVRLSPGSYTISSGSGLDYSKSFAPVPEPEDGLVVAALGLGLFWCLPRRRSNQKDELK